MVGTMSPPPVVPGRSLEGDAGQSSRRRRCRKKSVPKSLSAAAGSTCSRPSDWCPSRLQASTVCCADPSARANPATTTPTSPSHALIETTLSLEKRPQYTRVTRAPSIFPATASRVLYPGQAAIFLWRAAVEQHGIGGTKESFHEHDPRRDPSSQQRL